MKEQDFYSLAQCIDARLIAILLALTKFCLNIAWSTLTYYFIKSPIHRSLCVPHVHDSPCMQPRETLLTPTLTQISSQNMKKLTFKNEPCSYFNWQAASILSPPWPALIITPARVWLLLSRRRLCFICYGFDASLKKYRGDLFGTHLSFTYFYFILFYFFTAKWCPWLCACVCVALQAGRHISCVGRPWVCE